MASPGCGPRWVHSVGSLSSPHGFLISVGILQHVHRRLALWHPSGGGAGLPEALEFRKDQEWPSLGDECPVWCLYLDDSTLLNKVERNLADSLEGKPLEEQARLRRAYQFWGIPYNEKKAIEQVSQAERLGAFLDGDKGRIGATVKRILECLSLGLWLLAHPRLGKKALRVYGGKEVHCLQFRRPLFSIYDELWRLIGGNEERPWVTMKLCTEMMVAMCLAPLRFTSWRNELDPYVMASDASEHGGAFSMAKRLSALGVAESLGPADRQEEDRSGILVFDFFAGIGGLLRSLDRIHLRWEHHVVIEKDKHCRRLIRRTWKGGSEYNDFLPGGATLQLLQTKSSGHQIHSERLLAWDSLAVQALRFLCKGLQPGDYLIPLSAVRFRTLWHRATQFLLLHDFYIMPYSLRRGGATSAFRRGTSFEQLMVRGRWAHQRTARIYLDEALQQSAMLQFTAQTSKRLAICRQRYQLPA